MVDDHEDSVEQDLRVADARGDVLPRAVEVGARVSRPRRSSVTKG